MDIRGARMSGPPPQPSFRPRGGRGNNHHQIANHNHHLPQGQPRVYNYSMARPQGQWSPQSPHGSQAEGLNYVQPTFIPEPGYNYAHPHHQQLPSPELMSSSPQPPGFSPYPPQMFIQQPVMYDPGCYQQPIVAPSPVVPIPEPASLRNRASGFQYNSKDNVTHCANCGHKNVLAETEFIKRDERIDILERQMQVCRKQIEDMMAENTALRLKMGDTQVLPVMDLKEESKSVSVNVSESTVETSGKENTNDVKPAVKPLSPDAIEFSPKSGDVTPAVAPEVPVVSAKGMADDEGVSSSVILAQEAATQVEENLFEKPTSVELPDTTETVDGSNETNKDQVTHMNWSDEMDMDKTQEVSLQESKMEEAVQPEVSEPVQPEVSEPVQPEVSEPVQAEVPEPVQAEVPTREDVCPTALPENNWREQNAGGSTNAQNDHFQQKNKRYNQSRGGNRSRNNSGPGRGRRGLNDGDQQADRMNNTFNRNDNRGYGNPNRYPRINEENREQPKDNNISGKNNKSYQKLSDENWDEPQDNNVSDKNNKGSQKTNEKSDGYEENRNEQENRSKDENQSREKNNTSKLDVKTDSGRDSKNTSPKNAWGKEKTTQEKFETKNPGNPVHQGHGAWTGKNPLKFNTAEKKESFNRPQTFNKEERKESFNRPQSFNKEERKESFNRPQTFNKEEREGCNRPGQNQNQGYLPNRNRQYSAQTDYPNIVKEEVGDLFTCPSDFSLAHCVGEDFRMGRGIAVKFKEEYGRVGELLEQNVGVGGCAHLEDKGRYIFYLVTKQLSIGKPIMEDLQKSLKAMKDKCERFGVKKLAMPQIGCGLDRLVWSRVKSSINEIFHNVDIEIRIYEWNVEGLPESEGNRPEPSNSLQVRFNDNMRLVNIEAETALIIFGTEDGYMDPTAVSLNEKHHFELEYKKAEKKIGEVVVLNQKSKSFDYVFALIVAKTKGEKIVFTNVEKCLGQLSQLLRKNRFRYAGIEYLQGWSQDELFFEKIQTLLRALLNKSIQLWICTPNPSMDLSKPIRDKIREAYDRDRDHRDRGRANYK